MWNSELVELLISKYQEHEHLYNVRNPLYMDRVKRSNSLFEICKELKEVNTNITVEEIKKKLHTLRSQYIKESRLIATSKRSGVGAEDVYQPKLWFFDQMEVLKPHCAIRKSESNISMEDKGNTSIEEEEVFIDLTSQCPAQPSKKKKKTSQLAERIDNVKSLFIKRLQEKSDYDWLGKQVVFEMNSLKHKKLQRDTAWKIQQVLREASVKNTEDDESLSQISSGFQSDTQSSFSSGLLEERPVYSTFASVRTPEGSTSSVFFPIHPVRPTTSISNDASASYSPSPDILQQSLYGVLDDEEI